VAKGFAGFPFLLLEEEEASAFSSTCNVFAKRPLSGIAPVVVVVELVIIFMSTLLVERPSL
jgi:hypothetical protein